MQCSSQNMPHTSKKAKPKNANKRSDRTAAISSKFGKSMDLLGSDFASMTLKGDLPNSTGIIYDERMVEHCCLYDPKYPECPERFSDSLKRCHDYNLLERCHRLQSRPATKDEIMLQHDQEYVEFLENTKNSADTEYLCDLSKKYNSTYFHPTTYELSLLAAGCTIDLVSDVVNNKLKNGMAIVRPPGHHAMRDKACGYCYFNNVAIAAKHTLDNLGLKRILIVDWDVHHGQATQYAFYDDPRVLYFSIHRYENGAMWPHLRESDYDHIGTGPGEGFNINVPLNKIGLGNSEYLAIFQQILMPIAYEFSPELVIVSAGYDAAIGCPEGQMEVTPACYAHLTSMLMSLASGKVCVILEGGYCLKSLAEGVALTLRTLLGDPCPLIGATSEPDLSAVQTILDVISVHRPFWMSLRFQESILDDSEWEDDWPQHTPKVEYVGTPLQEPFPVFDVYPEHSAQLKAQLASRIDDLIANTELSHPSQRTCIVFDKKMMFHRNLQESHPENPERFVVILALLEETGLLRRCKILKSRSATEEELQLFHCVEYVQDMKKTLSMKSRDLLRLSELFRSIYLCRESYDSALLASGSLLQVIDDVVLGKTRNGAAVIRPPGHHAEFDEACGFCIFNNVALAAKYALAKYELQRILIVDWDVHHGNGVQNAFYDDKRVLYISLHRYNNGSYFPSSTDANFTNAGQGAGEGYNVNIPWNTVGLGDADYLAAFMQVVLPLAHQFDPQLILVSAGFDAAKGDFLGNCNVSPEGYATMTHLLSCLANGKLILALEGGYNLASLSTSFAMCVKVLLGDSFVSSSAALKPCQSAVQSIKNVISVQKKFWSCLKYQVNLPAVENKEDILEVQGAEGGDVSSLVDTLTSLTITTSLDDDLDGSSVFAIIPKLDCPHLKSVNRFPDEANFELNVSAPCSRCRDRKENWLCLACHEVFCGRYINGHMIEHHQQSNSHCVSLSFSDLSVWCYRCDSYVHDKDIINPVKEYVHEQKFGYLPPN